MRIVVSEQLQRSARRRRVETGECGVETTRRNDGGELGAELRHVDMGKCVQGNKRIKQQPIVFVVVFGHR